MSSQLRHLYCNTGLDALHVFGIGVSFLSGNDFPIKTCLHKTVVLPTMYMYLRSKGYIVHVNALFGIGTSFLPLWMLGDVTVGYG